MAVVELKADETVEENIQVKEESSEQDETIVEKKEEDTEAQMEALEKAKKEFLKGRKIIIKNTPATSKEEINIFLGGYVARDIEINRATGEVFVTLANEEEAEDVVKELNGVKMLDREVHVSTVRIDKLLCITHLPLDYTDAQLRQFASPYGPIIKCFMFRAEDTGESKGYGIVEYGMDLEKTKRAQSVIDWKEEGGYKVHCDFLDQNLSEYHKVNSKCLFVDNLPKDFKEVNDLREIFSKHVSPVYCQIVMKEGQSLGYGIIEYSEWADAEKTQRILNGHKINDCPIRITYCIPGKSAVAVCARLMTKYDHIKAPSKPSLLPDPVFPCHATLSHPLVTQLMRQHSELNQNFKQALQQLQQTYVNQLTTRSSKPGLLGPAPSTPMNPLMNPTLQLGLVILVALQIQTKCLSQEQEIGQVNLLTLLGNPDPEDEQKLSLLGDPVASQANIILQNLMAQVSSDKTSSAKLQLDHFNLQNVNLNSLVSLGQLTSTMDSTGFKPRAKGASLLGEPPEYRNYDNRSGEYGPEGDEQNSGNPFMRNIEMLAAQNLRQMGSDGRYNGSGKSSLLGDAPPMSGGPRSSGLLPEPDTSSYGYNSGNYGDYGNSGDYGSQGNYGGYYDRPNYGDQYGGYNDNYGYARDDYYDNQGNSGYGQYGQGPRNMNYRPDSYSQGGNYGDQNIYGSYRKSTYSGENEPDYESMAAQAQAYASTPKMPPSNYGSSYDYSSGYGGYSDYGNYSNYNNNYYGSYSSGYSNSQPDPPGTSSQPPPPPPGEMAPPPLPPSGPPGQSSYGSYGSSGPSRGLLRTPQGQKRPFDQLLPDPEPSPEFDYIGQHSQGIGGHYAESYRKRQKLDIPQY